MQLISQTLKNVLPPQNNQKQQEQEDPPYITTLKTNEYLIIRVPSKANQCCFTNGNLIEILTNDTTIFKSSDNNSACLQFCCCILTPFTYDLFDTSPLISYYHPFTCFPCCFKCCCRQSVIYSKDNKSNGRVIENWRYHIPSYRVVDSSGVHQFDLQPPTCCGGYCVDYYHAGCCRSDFFLFPPNSTSKFGTQVGHVKWSPLRHIEVKYPVDIDVDTKLRIIGGAFLINQLHYFDSSATCCCRILECASWCSE